MKIENAWNKEQSVEVKNFEPVTIVKTFYKKYKKIVCDVLVDSEFTELAKNEDVKSFIEKLHKSQTRTNGTENIIKAAGYAFGKAAIAASMSKAHIKAKN